MAGFEFFPNLYTKRTNASARSCYLKAACFCVRGVTAHMWTLMNPLLMSMEKYKEREDV